MLLQPHKLLDANFIGDERALSKEDKQQTDGPQSTPTLSARAPPTTRLRALPDEGILLAENVNFCPKEIELNGEFCNGNVGLRTYTSRNMTRYGGKNTYTQKTGAAPPATLA
jgi:hypothetical protein